MYLFIWQTHLHSCRYSQIVKVYCYFISLSWPFHFVTAALSIATTTIADYHWIMSILFSQNTESSFSILTIDIYKLMIWQKYVLKYLVEQTFVIFSLALSPPQLPSFCHQKKMFCKCDYEAGWKLEKLFKGSI